MDVSIWIDKMVLLRNEMCKLDSEGIYHYYPPNKGSSVESIHQVEKHLGIKLDSQYVEFLKLANGWREFYQSVSMLGTRELISSSQMTMAKEILSIICPLNKGLEFKVDELLPIAIDEYGGDLFVMTPTIDGSSKIIWFAGQEIDRFDSFSSFLDAILEYTEEELDDFKNDI